MSHKRKPVSASSSLTDELDEQAARLPYQAFWHEVSAMSRQEGSEKAAWVAENNAHDLIRLERALTIPTEVHYAHRTFHRDEVPEEWYLKLGPMNRLHGAQHMLRIGFARLWESAQPHPKFSPDPEHAFKQAALDILSFRYHEKGLSPLFTDIAADPVSITRAILAGNVILDFVRATPFAERRKSHRAFLDVSKCLYEGLLEAVLGHDPYDPFNKRNISDALKFKYETEFETLVTEWKTGHISEDLYRYKLNLLLFHQLVETRKLAEEDRLTNGDLNEHYFVMLLRYGMTGWLDETRYMVHAATRRQDEPHDGFAPMDLPSYSFDASISDTEEKEPVRYVQLKLPHAKHKQYVDGIIVIDDILNRDEGSDRHEIMEGMLELQGLVHELASNEHYAGSTDKVIEHINAIHRDLPLQPVVT